MPLQFFNAGRGNLVSWYMYVMHASKRKREANPNQHPDHSNDQYDQIDHANEINIPN
jgi:hypothetical protein